MTYIQTLKGPRFKSSGAKDEAWPDWRLLTRVVVKDLRLEDKNKDLWSEDKDKNL